MNIKPETIWPDNRIKIKSVHIKNFRSIRSETIEVKDLNIFVGLNDAGKSNFLKALNLFFNGYTDYDIPFSFERDFSFLFPQTSHNAREIVIEIKFIVPSTFNNSGLYLWKKVWRANGYFDEKITKENGEAPSSRSRIPGTLRKIKFRYVPAVKSKQYYKELLGELYLTISSVINSPLKDAIVSFSEVLQNYTQDIQEEVKKQLEIDSQLSMPENLTEVFKAMIFQTHNSDIEKSIPLDMRGDGVQARHIPIILRYIETQDRQTTSQGALSVFTIWGYEEPENGVELAQAFKMAKSFHAYSEAIQVFTTTHSPAFYTQKEKENAKIFYVTKEATDVGTKANENKAISEISKSMGLMPVVAKYIAEKDEELRVLKEAIHDSKFTDIDTIAVEGVTDRDYITEAIKLFSPELSSLIANGKLRIFTKEGEGGCKALVDYSLAWILSKNKSKLVVLFDKDSAGIKSHDEITSNEFYKTKGNSRVYVKYLEPSEVILESIYKAKLDLSYEIEHLLSLNCWKQIVSKNWVEPRSIEELVHFIGASSNPNVAITDAISLIINDDDLKNTIILNNPHTEKKTNICNWVIKQTDEIKAEYLAGFKRTIEKLESIII